MKLPGFITPMLLGRLKLIAMAALLAFASVQTLRLGTAQLRIEQLRHGATQLQASFLEATLAQEREFTQRQRAREAAAERVVAQLRGDLEREREEAIDVQVCGPADRLSERTRERLRQLAEALAVPDS